MIPSFEGKKTGEVIILRIQFQIIFFILATSIRAGTRPVQELYRYWYLT